MSGNETDIAGTDIAGTDIAGYYGIEEYYTCHVDGWAEGECMCGDGIYWCVGSRWEWGTDDGYYGMSSEDVNLDHGAAMFAQQNGGESEHPPLVCKLPIEI